MTDANDKNKPMVGYNIIANRGDPKTATTLSGHHVEKKEDVIIPSPFDGTMISLKCADYHLEHFVYIDPLFQMKLPDDDRRQVWFAMCTCGSPAVIIGPGEASVHEDVSWLDRMTGKGINVNMLVCQFYMMTLLEHNHGWHMNQDKKEWR